MNKISVHGTTKENLNFLIAKRTRMFRVRLGLRITEVAEHLNTHPSYVSAWETQQKILPLSKACEISRLFDVRLDVLMKPANVLPLPFFTTYRNMGKGKKDILENFGGRLNKLQSLSDISDQHLSNWLQTSKKTIKRWQNGMTFPNSFQCYKLSRTFRLEVDELIPFLDETDLVL